VDVRAPSFPSVLIALHRGSSWIGKLIEWQTRSHYSHAALVFIAPGEEMEHNADRNRPARLCEVVESREFHGVRVTEGIIREPDTAVDLFSVPLLTRIKRHVCASSRISTLASLTII
jgi:hypothetical protein